MSTTQVATAVAPVNGKDIAVHTTRQITGAVHLGLTALAEIVIHGGAKIACTIDKSLTMQGETDYHRAKTALKIQPLINKMSGYKLEELSK